MQCLVLNSQGNVNMWTPEASLLNNQKFNNMQINIT